MVSAWPEPCPDGCSDSWSIFGGTVVATGWLERMLATYMTRTPPVDRCPPWRVYLGQWNPHGRAAVNAIARWCKANGWVGRSGFEVNVDNVHWRTSDGETVGFSHRGWGDFMAHLVGQGDYRAFAWERRPQQK